MEVRIIVISDSGQTTPYEFKSFDEAINLLVEKAGYLIPTSEDIRNDWSSGDKELDEKVLKENPPLIDEEIVSSMEDSSVIIDDTITSTEPVEKEGFIHTLINKIK